jgi:hypothetical protein
VETKSRQKLLLFAAATGVLLLLGDSLIVSPLISSWKDREKEIADLTTSNRDGSRLIAREQVVRGSWERMQTNTLPVDASLAGGQMLKAFYRWGQDSGINIVSIKSQEKPGEDEYMMLECRVDATGNMQAVSRFLYEMEKDPLGLKLEAMELSAHDNEGQQLALGLQVSGLILSPPPQ